jgi:hypothetical protein
MTAATKTLLTTRELEEATAALVYPRFSGVRSDAARQKLDADRAAWKAAEKELEGQWKNWLNLTYCYDLPDEVANEIFVRAWSDGHSSGYNSVENAYEAYATFAEFVVKSVRNGN